jgi:hypothetical protein
MWTIVALVFLLLMLATMLFLLLLLILLLMMMLAVWNRGEPILQFAVDTLSSPCSDPEGSVEEAGEVIATALGIGFLCDLEVSQSRHAAIVLQETVTRYGVMVCTHYHRILPISVAQACWSI